MPKKQCAKIGCDAKDYEVRIFTIMPAFQLCDVHVSSVLLNADYRSFAHRSFANKAKMDASIHAGDVHGAGNFAELIASTDDDILRWLTGWLTQPDAPALPEG